MKSNITVAIVTGFVLAMALAFGGHMLGGTPGAAPTLHMSN